jgi:hypothetical protein
MLRSAIYGQRSPFWKIEQVIPDIITTTSAVVNMNGAQSNS